MKIRQAKNGEISKILEVANNAFEPVRYKGYDFKVTMPQIYNTKIDYSKIHFVCEEEKTKNLVSVGGNLIRKISLKNNKYLFSNVGTVSTLPKFQGNGYMSKIMNKIEEQNVRKKVVFSILTGDRKRYNNFGYEKVGFTFKLLLSSKLVKCNNNSIVVKEFQKNQKIISQMYDIYLKNIKIILRSKEEFVLNLQAKGNLIFTLLKDEKVVGYFSFNKTKEQIDEFYLSNIDETQNALDSIFNYFNLLKIYFFVNPFDKEYYLKLQNFAESVETYDEIHLKVYNLEKFLEMIFKLNLVATNFKNKTYFYKINNVNYKIDITNNNLIIEKGNFQSNYDFTIQEFLRYIFSPTNFYDNEKLTLLFSFNKLDMF